mmetsp:Transcript_12888/g.21881  ORF Transcript_12888/g.21881 Transcript_12888/m.21881 type:complete len:200 (+) Transcript_12888:13-612(+)
MVCTYVGAPEIGLFGFGFSFSLIFSTSTPRHSASALRNELWLSSSSNSSAGDPPQHMPPSSSPASPSVVEEGAIHTSALPRPSLDPALLDCLTRSTSFASFAALGFLVFGREPALCPLKRPVGCADAHMDPPCFFANCSRASRATAIWFRSSASLDSICSASTSNLSAFGPSSDLCLMAMGVTRTLKFVYLRSRTRSET